MTNQLFIGMVGFNVGAYWDIQFSGGRWKKQEVRGTRNQVRNLEGSGKVQGWIQWSGKYFECRSGN